MDDVECSTSDFFLQNCSYTYSTPTETYHNCQHWEDVGVSCMAPEPPLPDPSSWQFRLVGGKTNDTGRLEVRPSATDDWGTVCDDPF